MSHGVFLTENCCLCSKENHSVCSQTVRKRPSAQLAAAAAASSHILTPVFSSVKSFPLYNLTWELTSSVNARRPNFSSCRGGEKSLEVSLSLLHQFSSQSFPDPQLWGLQKLSKSFLFLLRITFILFCSFCSSKADIRDPKSSLMSH